MRLTDLRDKMVCTSAGKRLGRVHDVQTDRGEVTVLKCGPAGLIERMTARSAGRTIAWSRVMEVTKRAIIVRDDN